MGEGGTAPSPPIAGAMGPPSPRGERGREGDAVKTFPSLFLSHGSPMLALSEVPARDFLAGLGEELGRPEAILVASAHWETPAPLLNSVARNETIHDFAGFRPELYRLAYPAPGAPGLAERAAARL